MTSFRTRLSRFAAEHPRLSNRGLARKFLLSIPQKTLVQLLAEEFQHLRRDLVRSVEAQVLSDAVQPIKTLAQRTAALKSLSPLLDKSYPTLSGAEMELRDMRLPELYARRNMLVTQQNGIERSVEIVDRVIALCEAANVECLAEIEVAA